MKMILLLILSLIISNPIYSQTDVDSIQITTCGNTLFYKEVVNPKTGRIWLDRNLGASRVAESKWDTLAYGNLYQWGRYPDRHECIEVDSLGIRVPKSDTTHQISLSSDSGHSKFIITNELSGNWLRPEDPSLWKSLSSKNNPCPNGFRIPTASEWEDEIKSWETKNNDGAFDSALKLSTNDFRSGLDGKIMSIDNKGNNFGYYWASNFRINAASFLLISNSSRMALTSSNFGFCVRCIKDNKELKNRK